MEGMKFFKKPVRSLDLLKVTQEKKTKYYNINEQLRQACSIYSQNSTLHTTELYHLHPQFIKGQTTPNVHTGQDEPVPLLDHIATICDNCNKDLILNKLPEFSLAKGFDYGDITRIPQWARHFGTPTIAERMVIGLSIPYSKIIQLQIKHKATGKLMLTTHMITMPFSGPKVRANHNPKSANPNFKFNLKPTDKYIQP
jgi:hypothetical protein